MSKDSILIVEDDEDIVELLAFNLQSAGFAAETASATILVTASSFGMPVSTTHSISTAIMGVGFGKNPRKLKVTVIERIVWAWILTIPAAAGIAYGLQRLIEAMGWT